MLVKQKPRFKTAFKSILKLRENVQNRKKVLRFTQKKWQSFIFFYKKKLKNYNRYRPKDLKQYYVTKYPKKWSSYKKRYNSTLKTFQKFKLFYGNLTKKNILGNILKIKKTTNKLKNLQLNLLQHFESRLDVIIYRAKFATSIRNARQFIVHKNIKVNGIIVVSPNYIIKTGDKIVINPKLINVIETNLRTSNKWPLPPKHLYINYKTTEIIFGETKFTNFTLDFPYNINLEKLIIDSPRI
jgi:small subunit ribosomal protein S4